MAGDARGGRGPSAQKTDAVQRRLRFEDRPYRQDSPATSLPALGRSAGCTSPGATRANDATSRAINRRANNYLNPKASGSMDGASRPGGRLRRGIAVKPHTGQMSRASDMELPSLLRSGTLEGVVAEYVHYNAHRPHRSLGLLAPETAPTPLPTARASPREVRRRPTRPARRAAPRVRARERDAPNSGTLQGLGRSQRPTRRESGEPAGCPFGLCLFV